MTSPTASDDAGIRRANEIAAREMLDVETQITRADAKALGIVSALALVAALLVISIGKVHLPAAVAILVAVLAFIVALSGALRALHPRTKGSHDPGDIHATMGDLLDRGNNPTLELERLAQQLVGRRAALAGKMRVLRISFRVTYFALFCLSVVVTIKLV